MRTRDVAAGVELRIYTAGPAPRPTVLFLHGGGWVFGSIATHDATCRALAAASGAGVVSVGYRRAPEHPFPAAVHDAVRALDWVRDEGARHGLDPDRVAVAGDSAGGNLAAALARVAWERGDPVALQTLAYPIATLDVDAHLDPAYDGTGLSREELHWHQEQYFARAEDRRSPLAAPLEAGDLARAPETLIITAHRDPVRPQGEAYARALRAAGVACTLIDCPGVPHGFLQWPGSLPAADAAIEQWGRWLRRRLARGD